MQSPLSPFGNGIPAGDSSIFLYMSWELLNGKILYKEIWDHKGPFLYIINAVGLFFGCGNTLGVWLIELIGLSISSYISLKILSPIFNTKSAFLGTFTCIMTLGTLLQQGNFSEEYALPFQFLALFIFLKIQENKKINIYHIMLLNFLGIICGITFLLRPNLIGIWIAIFIILTIKRLYNKKYGLIFSEYGFFLTGICIAFIPFILYFFYTNSFNDAIYAVWSYNIIYSKVNNFKRITAIIMNIQNLSATGSNIFMILGILLGTYISIKYKFLNYKQKLIIYTSLVSFLIIAPVIGISGRDYQHYSIAYLPVIAIASTFLYWLLDLLLKSQNLIKSKIIIIIIILSIAYYPIIYTIKWSIVTHRSDLDSQKLIAELITTNSREDDYIFVFGARPAILFLAKRHSPTRFFYSAPINTKEYYNETLFKELMNDLYSNKPKFIIISESYRSEILNSQQNFSYELYSYPLEIKKLITFIDNNYTIKTIIDSNIIYENKLD